jgi:prepilin-type N-terminal cleavage/methylation domain-containing protein
MNICTKKLRIKAFTLVEIMMAIAIVSLLSSIVYVQTGDARDKAVDVKNQKVAKNVEIDLELALIGGLSTVRLLAQSNPSIMVTGAGVATSTDVPGASFDEKYGLSNTNPQNSLADIIESGIVPVGNDFFDTLPKVSSKLNGGISDDIYYISNGSKAIDSKGYEYTCVDPSDLAVRTNTLEGEEYGPVNGYTLIDYNPLSFQFLHLKEIPSEIYFTLSRGDRSDAKKLIIRNYYNNWWLPYRNHPSGENYLPDLPLFQNWIHQYTFSAKLPYYSDADLLQGKTFDERRYGLYTCL